MDRISDEMLGKLLRGYDVAPPSDDLLERTRLMMQRHLAARREELALEVPAARKSSSVGLVVSVLVLGVLVCCNLFYVATVGTVLKLVLPSTADIYLNQSLIGVSVGGAALVIGMVLTAFFKVYIMQRNRVQAVAGH